MAKSSGMDYRNSNGDTMGDAEPVTHAQFEAVCNELDEVYAMLENMTKEVSTLCKAVDEVMVHVSGDESVAMTFTHYPPGGPKHEN